ncbi:hypothetical protein F5Y06DRAFT_306147 [Hypoxylon sp. FL0890]|nr:hypothetical protein F5Y06DRAFT_306147 [Hypoxylon sp. FL0890]
MPSAKRAGSPLQCFMARKPPPHPKAPKTILHLQENTISTDINNKPKTKARSDPDKEVIYLGPGRINLLNVPLIHSKRGPKLRPIRQPTLLDILAMAALKDVTPNKPQPVEPYTWTSAELSMMQTLLRWRTAVQLNRETRRMLGL